MRFFATTRGIVLMGAVLLLAGVFDVVEGNTGFGLLIAVIGLLNIARALLLPRFRGRKT